MQPRKYRLLNFVFLSFLVINLFIFSLKAEEINITGYVADGPKVGNIYAAYIIINNPTNQDIKLVEASSSAFNRLELHISEMVNGMMKMRELESIDVKAKDRLVMKPGSYHLMLIGKLKEIDLNDEIDVELVFDDGSKKQIDLKVKKREMTNYKMMH